MMLGAFATMTLLTKNSFLDEIRKQYVLTCQGQRLRQPAGALRPYLPQRYADRDRGLPRRLRARVLFRLALIETIFSLDGLGLLGFESVLNRDYPVCSRRSYIFALIGLVVNLISDLAYTWIDPRIDFETREV
jgi:microcin C transport system permease protein